jgi:hypothetical protein
LAAYFFNIYYAENDLGIKYEHHLEDKCSKNPHQNRQRNIYANYVTMIRVTKKTIQNI